MNAADFKKSINTALLNLGFTKSGQLLCRSSADVSTLIALEKGFGDQWIINVGFWLNELGGGTPKRLEQSHMYYRLERLCPEFREVILGAGALGEEDQPRLLEELTLLLRNDINRTLLDLKDMQGLRSALAAGRLENGLLRHEARDYLTSKT